MNVSVSEFIKKMNEDDFFENIHTYTEQTDRSNEVIIELRRNWEINKILK